MRIGAAAGVRHAVTTLIDPKVAFPPCSFARLVAPSAGRALPLGNAAASEKLDKFLKGIKPDLKPPPSTWTPIDLMVKVKVIDLPL